MTDIIISFDSEDYLTPQAADAELWWAQELNQRKIRGSFQLVAELIRTLQRWGREDVIQAIAQHEIGYHSNYHSLYPTHPEAVESLSLADGIRYVMAAETPGLSTLATTFKEWPISYCSPGDSWTPATLLAMSRMGIKVFCNDRIQKETSVPYWYCGVLVAKYAFDFQRFYEEAAYQPGDFEQAFNALVEKTPQDGVIVLYTHPTRLVTSAFWDQVFANGKRPAIKDCPPAPLRSPQEIAANQARCKGYLDWLRGRSDLRFIDFATLYKERSEKRHELQDILNEASILPGQESDLLLRSRRPADFLPATAFDSMKYNWIPYTPGFQGQALVQQARQLAWTAAAAQVTRPSTTEQSR